MDDAAREKKLLSAQDIERVLKRLAHQVVEKYPDLEQIALIGIQTRGVYLAQRLQKRL